jgi:hydroxymethylbilane synthase
MKYGSMEDLPPNAKVGTSSLRRESQMHALRPDLQVHPLRGNVDTRLRKLESGEFDAIILAAAGLQRLGRADAIRQIIPVKTMCPAAGQGALAIEIRAGDAVVSKVLAFLDDKAARAETECERALLQALGGGCQVPIGASARYDDGRIDLHAIVASPDGTALIKESGSGDDPALVGKMVAAELVNQGGAAILAATQGLVAIQPEQP